MKSINIKIIFGMGLTLSAIALLAAIAIPKVQRGELTEDQVYFLGIPSIAIAGIGLVLTLSGAGDSEKEAMRRGFRDALKEWEAGNNEDS